MAYQQRHRVVHLACLPTHASAVDPVRAFLVNTWGTFNVLQAARLGGASRAVVASSASVYGRPQSVPIAEEHPTHPTSPYAASKLAGDVFVPAYAGSYEHGAAVLRIFNVFGKSADGRRRPTFETIVAERARQSMVVELHGSADQARDFGYVGDVVRALASALQSSVSGTYNIGSGQACPLHLLAITAGIPPRDILLDASVPDPEPSIYQADITKARDELGFRPTLDVLDFVRSLVGDLR